LNRMLTSPHTKKRVIGNNTGRNRHSAQESAMDWRSANQPRLRLPRQSISIKKPPVNNARALPTEPGSISGVPFGIAKTAVGQAANIRAKPHALRANRDATESNLNRMLTFLH
jgi:hypothetical protein